MLYLCLDLKWKAYDDAIGIRKCLLKSLMAIRPWTWKPYWYQKFKLEDERMEPIWEEGEEILQK